MSRALLKNILAFIGYQLRRSHSGGHGIHSPFLYALVFPVFYARRTILSPKMLAIQKVRRDLLKSKEILRVEDLGAGSSQLPFRDRKVADIARVSSSSEKYGRMLTRLVGYLEPVIIVELGTCLGLGSMYMAAGNEKATVYTLEGSETLLKKAREGFDAAGFKNIVARQGNFDVQLPVILSETGRFDLLYVDGNHRKDATLRYFNFCESYAHRGSVIIFDDIRWSAEMLEAWRDICEDARVTLSIDLFKMGIVFFNDKLQKQHYEIFY
jgi:predicted O-methyltransferase YrrM